MARQRLSASRWRQLVADQCDSGLSVEAFCRREGLGVSTFFAWRRRLVSGPRPAFVEVTAAAVAAEVEPIELMLALGIVVRVRSGFDAVLLRQVVEALS